MDDPDYWERRWAKEKLMAERSYLTTTSPEERAQDRERDRRRGMSSEELAEEDLKAEIKRAKNRYGEDSSQYRQARSDYDDPKARRELVGFIRDNRHAVVR